jgi:hypothetical protein
MLQSSESKHLTALELDKCVQEGILKQDMEQTILLQFRKV